ncbi:hypothetical protein Pla110_16200 [Polystyrenella longa]|uniref:Uncharacterized protein n=1 Tax=Polystyrenella longa TaxID=2528007 RepID=A0A518CKZ6_9PLAN|nr:hypothetical protein Pla110_16200 [Polystyrenella longa]
MDRDLSVVGAFLGSFMILHLAWTIFKLINSCVVIKRNGPVLFYLNDYSFQSMAAPQAIYLCLFVLGVLIFLVIASLAGWAGIPVYLFLIVAPTPLFCNMLQFAFCSRVGVTRQGLIYSRLSLDNVLCRGMNWSRLKR